MSNRLTQYLKKMLCVDGCIIYRLLSILIQRDVVYQNYQSHSSYPHLSLQELQGQNFKMLCQYLFQ